MSELLRFLRDMRDNGYGMAEIAAELKSNIRSADAAFDPMQRESSNLLAQSAKLAPASALGAYMYSEKQKEKKGKQ